MKIYFIRHAQSEGNISSVEHHDGVSLSEEGKKQAEFLANRISSLPIDVIVCSTYGRTQETAEIINKKIGKNIILNDFLVERKVPSSIIGKHSRSTEVLDIYNLLRQNFKKIDARHSDEENFEDLSKRAGEALNFIKSQPYENILVVTHGSFSRVLLARMIFGENITGHEFASIHRSFDSSNTGITVVEHKIPESDLQNEWVIKVWNDHAHLGEIK